MGKEAARGALSPDSLAREREKYARASAKAAASLSKQRPPEYHENQNASRAGSQARAAGERHLVPLQPRASTPEQQESLELDQRLIAGRQAAEAEHAVDCSCCCIAEYTVDMEDFWPAITSHSPAITSRSLRRSQLAPWTSHSWRGPTPHDPM
jgi:hypothetical protein